MFFDVFRPLKNMFFRSIEAELRAHRDLIAQEVEAVHCSFECSETSETEAHRQDGSWKMHCKQNGVVQKMKPRQRQRAS